MEVRQALADLAEVRGRLAGAQRFEGYSGWAAVSSGLAAVVAGLLQAKVAPRPATAHGLYLTLWLVCLGVALAINYGAILAWRFRNPNAQARAQMRTVGITILPAIAAGGVLTAALATRDLFSLLPGVWCAVYALGLFASRAMVPQHVTTVAVLFGIAATVLLLSPGIDPLVWWVMPLTFGLGQITIGIVVRSDPDWPARTALAGPGQR